MRLTREVVQQNHWGREIPALEDAPLHVDEPCEIIAPNGEPLLTYRPLDHSVDDLRAALPNIKTFQVRDRTSGMATHSTTFGFQNRIPLRRDYCGMTRTSETYPKLHARLCQLAQVCAAEYRAANPNEYDLHMATVQRDVLPEWILPGTPFTGGIINDTTALPYHRDRGNVPGSWSAMVTMRDDGIDGGWLVVPELGVALRTAHGSVLLFQGEQWWHGVSPLRRSQRKARRYTMVFYSLHGMRKCLCGRDEIARYKEVRTKREKNRHAGVLADSTRAAVGYHPNDLR